jgi:hypothetical protein
MHDRLTFERAQVVEEKMAERRKVAHHERWETPFLQEQ